MKASRQFLPPLLTILFTILLLGLAFALSPSVRPGAHADTAKVTPTINKKMNAKYVDNVQAAMTAVPNRLVPLDGSGKFALNVIPQGSGSGLDADKLDGRDSGTFAAAAHTHFGQKWTGSGADGLDIVTDNTYDALVGTQGAGSGFLTPIGAVKGDSSNHIGVIAVSKSNYGSLADSDTGTGLGASSISGIGLSAASISGFAIRSAGSDTQQRTDGGWVKALVLMSGGAISRCYNSQESTPNTTPPCGFTLGGSDGDYTINFGYTVNDRFVSVTPNWASGSAVIPVVKFPSANVVEVQTYSGGSTLVDSAFFLTIY